MTQNNPQPDFPSQDSIRTADKSRALLVEVAWEVANQVGGIYTVIRSKAPSMIKNWGERYLLIGPYVDPNISAIFESRETPDDAFGRAVEKMRRMGFEVHYGEWLISGRPRVVLFNPATVFDRLSEIKYLLWEHHGISTPGDDYLINQVAAFGWMIKVFLTRLTEEDVNDVNQHPLIAHVHEWMAATAIPEIRRDKLPIKTLFTTHATMLGRYLAMNDPQFYEHMEFYDWEKEARYFNIETIVRIERAAAHGAHVFTTVSGVTARECEYLVGRKPDVILPNGLNIARYEVQHEIQNDHLKAKLEIHRFIRGHFFQNYTFDLDKTLYFFTSGRYEYRNKGYDLTLEALARLNWRMKQANMDTTVVMFFITKRPFHSINPAALQSKATLAKLRETIDLVQRRLGDNLFDYAVSAEFTKFPDLNQLLDDHLRIKLRRNLQSWKSPALPPVVTHNLYDDDKDEILNFVRTANLINYREDRVKVIYHPDFLSSTSPLLNLDYGDFVRGTHLGVFPSYYEPWGYTPLEAMVSGVPAVTSDLAGFGDYLKTAVPNHEDIGMYVVDRLGRSFDEAANQLTDQLFEFVKLARADRIGRRYWLQEEAAEHFDWSTLTRHYEEAYDQVLAGD